MAGPSTSSRDVGVGSGGVGGPSTGSGGVSTSSGDVGERLLDPDLGLQLEGLGLAAEDQADARRVAEAVAQRPDALAAVGQLRQRLLARLGDFAPNTTGESVWVGFESAGEGLPPGVLALLTLVLTAQEVAAFHRGRGVPAEVSKATLADLGQQIRVHRLTCGGFGLHTQGWLSLVWSGALYRVGRLQFNLQRESIPDLNGGRPGWVLSTHIPRAGALAPDRVDAALAQARDLFDGCFPDYPARRFHCESWLLDPVLATELPGSNLAAFQQRWTLYGEPRPGEADVFFFGFLRRDPVDPATLPRDTRLQRLLADRLASGRGWTVRNGWLPTCQNSVGL